MGQIKQASKVLIVTAHFYPENFRINDVALDLSSKGYQVEVLTGFPDYPHRKNFLGFPRSRLSQWNGITIHRAACVSRGNGGSIRRVFNYLSFILACGLAGLTRDLQRPDVILVWASSPITVAVPAIWLKRIFKVPLAIWVQDLWPETLLEVGVLKNPQLLKALGVLVRWIYKNCDLIWGQSDGFRRSILKWLDSSQEVQVLCNWGDESDSTADAGAAFDLAETAKFKILFAGNLGQVQCLEEQLQAVEQLQKENILWTWIGGGSEETWLREQILRRGLGSVAQVLDRVSPREIQKYGQWADVLVVALQTGPALSETIPSKLQTYLYWGKPIIGLIDGEAARVISEAQCGFSTSAKEIEVFVGELKKMIRTSPLELQTYGENGRQYYEAHFFKRKILDRLESNLVSLILEKQILE